MTESSLKALSESWPSGLGQQFDTWIANGGTEGRDVALALKGSVDRFDQSLRLSGTIGTPQTPFIVSGMADQPFVEIPAEF